MSRVSLSRSTVTVKGIDENDSQYFVFPSPASWCKLTSIYSVYFSIVIVGCVKVLR